MIKKAIILAVGLFGTTFALAQDESFFTDPSLLGPWDQGTFDLGYVDADIIRKAQRYNAVMVDQPEIWMSPDSRYKGAKADHLLQLSDVARLAMISRLEEGGWSVVDEPGPNVVYIRWAISDLYLKKKKRGILSYTPVGFVVHSTVQASIQDLWKKIDIVELGIKIEWLDSVSGEILSAGHATQGARKIKGQQAQELVDWETLYSMLYTIGEQTRCHMDNNKLPEGQQRTDCDSIIIEPETE